MHLHTPRFDLLRPFLEDGVPLTQVAEAQHLSLRTARRWVALYRMDGLAGLIPQARSDQGKRRRLPTDLSSLIEGLALQKPKLSIAAIHRKAVQISEEQEWPPPSYDQIYAIIKALDPRLLTLAHDGSAAYRYEVTTQDPMRLGEVHREKRQQEQPTESAPAFSSSINSCE